MCTMLETPELHVFSTCVLLETIIIICPIEGTIIINMAKTFVPNAYRNTVQVIYTFVYIETYVLVKAL